MKNNGVRILPIWCPQILPAAWEKYIWSKNVVVILTQDIPLPSLRPLTQTQPARLLYGEWSFLGKQCFFFFYSPFRVGHHETQQREQPQWYLVLTLGYPRMAPCLSAR